MRRLQTARYCRVITSGSDMKEPLVDDVLECEDIENLLDAGRHQMTDPYVFGLYSFNVTV